MRFYRYFSSRHPSAPDVICLAVIILVSVTSKIQSVFLPYHWDEGVFANPAHWLQSNGLLGVFPGLHPPELFFGHPFALPMTLSMLSKIFGEQPAVGHILILALSTAGLCHTYLLGKLVHSRIAGLSAALLLQFTPLYFAQSVMLNGDIATTALGVMTVYYALRCRYLPYFVFAVLLLLTKETSVALFLCLQAYLFFFGEHKGDVKVALRYATPVVFFIIFFAAQKMATGVWLPNPYFKTNTLLGLDMDTLQLKAKTVTETIFISQYRYLLVVPIILNLLVNGKRSLRKEQLLFLAAMVSFIVPFILVFFLPRYLLPVFPYFCLMTAMAIAMLVRENTLATAAVTVGFVTLSTFKYTGTAQESGSHETDMQYVDVVTTHQNACDYIARYFPDRTVLTCWPLNRELREPHRGFVKKRIEAVYFKENVREDEYDLVLYSPQSDGAREKIRELVETRKMVPVATFQRNGKEVRLYTKRPARS